ncbi:hypothetical protein [Parasitella parasitica]|uniref:Reverse transcriptase domain-containing protein n=1 Tax=Parasitella parasitica TaxID=35722 RepID=A0A0B7NN03_9FUNG|nr:hypothetical protein [Parasitella parasitica]
MLDALPPSARLSPTAARSIVEPITFDDLCDAFSRAPSASSPGMDGLPYQLVHLIVTHPACREIALATFNNALTSSDLPSSWLESCIVLLPKKGPRELLQNWLINTDAKVFTRILSSRMIDQASTLINPFQTGFVRDRFIADNGLLMKLVMEHARNTGSSSIGLLLDQEKAYDRVHPVYLRAVLLRFGFPVALVDCISHLFFDTHLVVNVNGFLSPRVPQLRGLKQGDPISPILFNLAFEPLLRKILQDPHLSGYQLPSPQALEAPSAVKMMAFTRQHPMPSVNYHKTEAISLSGSSGIYGTTWRAALLRHNISSWHDARSPCSVRYLGFPLYTSIAQRNVYLNKLLDKVRQGCLIHQQRGLSVRGRSTVLNSLLLSSLWHVLRVVTVPVSFFASLQSIISSFLNFRIFPRISIDTACAPRSQGGLGLIHPQLQQSALQLRWLRPLLSQSTDQILSHPSIALPRLAGFLLSQQPMSSDVYRSSPQELDHRFSLLFPCRRPPFLRHNESSWSLLFKAIDRLPKDFSNTVASASTCLEVPLASVILPSSSSVELGRSLARLPSSVAYTMGSDPDSCLRSKQNTEFSVYPNLAKKFLKLVKRDDIQLSPFFVRAFIHSHFSSFGRFPFLQVEDHTVVDVSPFVASLNICSSRGTAMSTKSYRRLCQPPIDAKPPLPPPLDPDISVAWFDFWLLPISHSCRNIWYRFLHRKIPHKSLLHRFMPEFFPSPSCAICSDSDDTLDHFLFSCPLKRSVWHTIQQRHLPFLSAPWTSVDLHLLLTTVRFPVFPLQSALLVIAATLESIWTSHWSFIFSDTPFTLDSVLSLVESKLLRYRQESFLAAGIPHCPPPVFSAE